jgi:NAD(P)-dependent dehydrogenase (short-subunit alcohol dehydrogenase family)
MSDAGAVLDDLDGRVVVVTGASRGVGRGIARYLAERGARLVVSARGREGLDALSAELDELGVAHVARTADAADRDASFALVQAGVDEFGTVDGVVANAVTSTEPVGVEALRDDDLDVPFAAGVKGTVWLMQAAFPVMREQGRGRIVTFGSNAALAGVATYAAYSATKEAIRGITRTAATEWGRFGVTVNCVCPVSVRHHTPGLDDPETLAKFERSFRHQPVPRDGRLEEDIAPIVGFLLADASAFMTGQTLMADGGRIMLR